MNLATRIDLLVQLGEYMSSSEEGWEHAKRKAYAENNWFILEFVNLSVNNITNQFLKRSALEKLAERYHIPNENKAPKKVGIVMAGNIPLVGFHDLLAVFLCGHIAMIKPSSKDQALITQIVKKLAEWNAEINEVIIISEMLKNCDAYIATGSDNSSRYFEQYFGKYPHIIRRNRTSVAILSGSESTAELEKLADDVYQFFGLGCRNITQLYVPKGYDFVPLLNAFRKYNYLIDHNKFKNNYDYQLAAHLINNRFYMTNESLLLVENESPFAPISQIHYVFYDSPEEAEKKVKNNPTVQCIAGPGHTPFGAAQCPGITDYADGIDTLDFLMKL